MSDIKDQPAPIANDSTAIWDLVVQDMVQRNKEGINKYGTPLQTFNGRNSLIDLYQELLDAVVYTRQQIEEQKVIDEARFEMSRSDDELFDEYEQKLYLCKAALHNVMNEDLTLAGAQETAKKALSDLEEMNMCDICKIDYSTCDC